MEIIAFVKGDVKRKSAELKMPQTVFAHFPAKIHRKSLRADRRGGDRLTFGAFSRKADRV